jgi:ferric-dicitrate binding protein FerR (iron transport regulator)
MTEDEEFRALLNRYREGTASDEEIALLESRYIQWGTESNQPISEDLMQQSGQQMWVDISARTGVLRPVNKKNLWPRLAIAAAVAAVIFSAGLLFFKKQEKISQSEMTFQNDIAPGKLGATLTLANGKKIRLLSASNGELAKEAGVTISKSADGKLVYRVNGQVNDNRINTTSTEKGETYQVCLPDGSVVWLNAASSLTYNVNLINHGSRRVKLVGEGYFEIAKDKAHPFIVETHNQVVRVLGTHFNINSYKDENVTKTTLIEGSLQVAQLEGDMGKRAILRPGEASVMTNGGDLKVEPADIRNALAWKDGFFRFNQLTIDQVMTQLARWYAIEVVYEGKMPDEKFNGVIARDKIISEVLALLSYSREVKFKIEGRRVTVMR